MNGLKHFALFFISLLQTLIGMMTILYFAYPEEYENAPIVFYIILLVGFALLSCRLRGIYDMGLFLGIPEFILSPFSFLRWIISTVALVKSLGSWSIHFDYSESMFDAPTPVQMVLQFLFGFYFDGGCEVTKWSNIANQLFICIPLSVGQGACFWFGVKMLINGEFPLFPLFLFMGVTFLSALICAVRGQESSVSYYHGDYKFKNVHTGKTVKKYGDYNTKWSLTEEAEDAGWVMTSDGYGSYFTGWMMATIFSVPILCLTQVIGLLFALIASPVTHIYSSYTKLEYDEFRCSFLQRILHFYFNFVID